MNSVVLLQGWIYVTIFYYQRRTIFLLKFMRDRMKTIMIAVVVMFVLSCFAGYGLYSKSDKTSNSSKDYVIAEVNDHKIMRSELEQVVFNMAQTYGQEQITSKDMLDLRNRALEVLIIQKENLIIQKEIEKEIKERKIEISKEELEIAYGKVMDTFPTREEFKIQIENMGVSEKQIKDEIKQNLMKEKLMEDIVSDITVSDEEARFFYEPRRKSEFEDKNFDEVSADVIAAVKEDKKESKQSLFTKKIINTIDIKVLDKEIFNLPE